MIEFLRKFENRGTKIAPVNSILITIYINLQWLTLILYGVGVRCDRRRFSVHSPFIEKSMVWYIFFFFNWPFGALSVPPILLCGLSNARRPNIRWISVLEPLELLSDESGLSGVRKFTVFMSRTSKRQKISSVHRSYIKASENFKCSWVVHQSVRKFPVFMSRTSKSVRKFPMFIGRTSKRQKISSVHG